MRFRGWLSGGLDRRIGRDGVSEVIRAVLRRPLPAQRMADVASLGTPRALRRNGRKEVMELLLEKGARPERSGACPVRLSLGAGRWPFDFAQGFRPLLGAIRRVANLFCSYFLAPFEPAAGHEQARKRASNGCPVQLLIRTKSEAKGLLQRENGRPICFNLAPLKQIAISIAPDGPCNSLHLLQRPAPALRNTFRRKRPNIFAQGESDIPGTRVFIKPISGRIHGS